MPHALFLGSSLATIAVFPLHNPHFPSQPSIPGLSRFQRVKSYIRPLLTPATGGEDGSDQWTLNKYRQNNTLFFILILAGIVFFEAGSGSSSAGLFEVHYLIGAKLGKGAAFIFPLALLSAAFRLILSALVAALLCESKVPILDSIPMTDLSSVTKKTPDFPGEEEETNYRNKFMMALGYMILSLIVVANSFAYYNPPIS
ncbi:hypothetical protein BU17DRAFT_64690 [Hysterangium stoloniferum]|nr:hypothetical protein BU17DRAFT_64690 [Hysterangium stoloniferum]